jgi:asparagine synthase (glutamine-hydrolysing)
LSAFAVIYQRTNTPIEPGLLERIMDRLRHRGPDGSNLSLKGNIGLGHWHFWTTPEEVGERQPLEIDGLPYIAVLDGRLDNRPEVIAKLQIRQGDVERLSDAALILQAYARWGVKCCEHFIGAFAFIIYDQYRNELYCARDSLGDRTLYYSITATRLLIASEPWAIAGMDGLAPELNEYAVAHYFAMKATEDGQTLFKNIHELLPAHALLLNASGRRSWRYWQPDLSIKIRGKSNDEYAEEFRSLLEESVRSRLRASTPAGILMSGGLDSTSVACLAAHMIEPQPLTTISYVFNELTDCDERQYIEAVKALWGIRSIQIPCDDAWPLRDWQDWPSDPNQPEGNPYRLLKERAYHKAQKEGLRVLLTGGFGDHLYSAGVDWMVDLITEGRLVEAGKELYYYLCHAGPRKTLRAGYLQRVVRWLVNAIPGGSRLHRRQFAPGWLTPFSANFVVKDKTEPPLAFGRYSTLLGVRSADSCTGEIFYASRHTLELRHPYRDRRLIEFVLTLPAYQLFYHGYYKRILRTAMEGILPVTIRTRRQPTSLASLFLRGIERERDLLQTCIQDPEAFWRTFVEAGWILKHWNSISANDSDRTQPFISWLCISYASWYKIYNS